MSHDDAWKRSNTVKAEETSRLRKEAEVKLSQVDMRERELLSMKQRLEDERKRMETLASSAMAETDIYRDDGTLDPVKFSKFQMIQQAKERLSQIADDAASVDKQQAQTAIERTLAEVNNLMISHPEIAMSEPLQAVVQKVEQYGMRQHPDSGKLLDIYEVVDYAKKFGIDLETAYERMNARGMLLSVKGSGAPAIPSINIQVPSQPSSSQATAANLAERQAGAQLLDGKGALPTRPALQIKRSLGQNVKDASINAGAGKGNPALEKLGY